MEKQREQSGKKVEYGSAFKLPETVVTRFTGYDQLETKSSIAALIL